MSGEGRAGGVAVGEEPFESSKAQGGGLRKGWEVGGGGGNGAFGA